MPTSVPLAPAASLRDGSREVKRRRWSKAQHQRLARMLASARQVYSGRRTEPTTPCVGEKTYVGATSLPCAQHSPKKHAPDLICTGEQNEEDGRCWATVSPREGSPWSCSRDLDVPEEKLTDGYRPPKTSRRTDLLDTFFESTGECCNSIESLRTHFRHVDTENRGYISQEEFLDHVRYLVEQGAGPLDKNMLALMKEMVRRRFFAMELGIEKGRVSEDEWVHFMMLRSMAPSYVAARHLSETVKGVLVYQRHLLSKILEAFSEADVCCDGFLRRGHWQDAVNAADVGIRAHGFSVEDFDVNGDGLLDYFEFVSCLSGSQPENVDLAFYDLSKGTASWIPSAALAGRKFEGIWHTGVRAFGMEYWYGGCIFQQLPKNVPFGTPTKIVNLGKTLVTQVELKQFMCMELTSVFTPHTYDVLQNNCNSFSNAIVQYLLHGKQIPDEVRMQPTWAKDSAIVHLARPLLNKTLGGFGNGSAGACKRIDDLTHEWRNRVHVGDTVLRREHWIDCPTVAMITELHTLPEGRCADVVYFAASNGAFDGFGSPHVGRLWEWKVLCSRHVPVQQLYPCLEEVNTGATTLRVSMTVNKRAGHVLRRPKATAPAPFCERGHRMDLAATPTWLAADPCCCLCGSHDASGRMTCSTCKFEMCGHCLARGMSLSSGGGVWSDVLTPELGEELLQNNQWLRFLSSVYFYRADVNNKGFLGPAEVRWFSDRACAELGIPVLTKEELHDAVQRAVGTGAKVFIDAFEDLFQAVIWRVVRNVGSPVRVPFSVRNGGAGTPASISGSRMARSPCVGADRRLPNLLEYGGRNGSSLKM